MTLRKREDIWKLKEEARSHSVEEAVVLSQYRLRDV
jgi:hypothetical protein